MVSGTKKYLFVQKVLSVPKKYSPLLRFEREIREVVGSFINEPTILTTNLQQRKIIAVHSLCLESFVRTIGSYKYMKNIESVQRVYDDGDYWVVLLTESWLNYLASFRDHILIFLYYFYPKSFSHIKDEKEVTIKNMFGNKNASSITDRTVKQIKNIFCSSSIRNLIDQRHLLNHRAILFYADTYDKKSPRGRREPKIHTTDLQFDDTEIDKLRKEFIRALPKLIKTMQIIEAEYHKWALATGAEWHGR